MKKLLAVVALALAPLLVPTSAEAQGKGGGSYPVGGVIPTFTPASTASFAPVVNFSAPVFQSAAPTTFAAPVLLTNFANPVFAKDITNPLLPKILADNLLNGKGVKEFPGVALAPSDSKNDSGLLARTENNAKFEKLGPTHFKLEEGGMLLSLKGSSREASVDTPDGLVLLKSEGDIMVSYIASVLRVENISARGESCKIQIDKGIVGDSSKTLALAPGYELVVSDRTLLSGEIRPADAIARRKFHIFDNGQIAVNEFSVDSILVASPVIASILASEVSKKEHKCLDGMLKMAAVLNYVHGAGGFTVAPATGVATKPGAGTQ